MTTPRHQRFPSNRSVLGGLSEAGSGGGARFPRSDGVKLFNEFSHYLMNDAWCVARPKIRMESEGYHQYQERGGRIVKKMYADLESLAQNMAGAGAEIKVPTFDGNDKDRWLGKEKKKKAVKVSDVSADIDLLDSGDEYESEVSRIDCELIATGASVSSTVAPVKPTSTWAAKPRTEKKLPVGYMTRKEVATLAMTTPAKPVRSGREERYHFRVANAVQVWRVVPTRGQQQRDSKEFDKKRGAQAPVENRLEALPEDAFFGMTPSSQTGTIATMPEPGEAGGIPTGLKLVPRHFVARTFE